MEDNPFLQFVWNLPKAINWEGGREEAAELQEHSLPRPDLQAAGKQASMKTPSALAITQF